MDMPVPHPRSQAMMATPPPSEALADFIRGPTFPCVGARSAQQRGGITVLTARSLFSAWNDLEIIEALHRFVADYDEKQDLFRSLVVIFKDETTFSELTFERGIWERIQSLHDKDHWLGNEREDDTADDPADDQFSLSIAGRAFFVVGLHPGASRPGRRFRWPTMVFNLHDQFERLRADGRYQKLRDTIMDRDKRLNGSTNPMLADFGSVSEARQYSGRAVGKDWVCPFKPKPR
jgi:FPC/CPF motif-containing protein YcgG